MILVRAAPAMALLVAAGCGETGPRVSVDFARVPWEAPAAVEPAPSPPAISIPARSTAIPDLPARNLYLGEARERLRKAEATLAQNRRTAMKNLSDRLRRELEEELSSIEAERRQALAPEATARVDEAYRRLRSIFERFAAEIGPLRWRLAELSGFPEVGDRRQPDADHPERVRRAEESRELRSTIERLEEAYRREVERLLAGVRGVRDRELARLQAEMLRLREQMEQEVDRVVRSVATESLQLLKGGSIFESNRTLPPVKGARVEIPNSRPLPPAPTMPATPDDRGTWLTGEAKIWAASRGYRLVPAGPGVRDATEEFAQWRQKHKPGP